MKFYALRHGLSESNKLGKINSKKVDDPLHPDEIEEIKKVASELPKGLTKIYSGGKNFC